MSRTTVVAIVLGVAAQAAFAAPGPPRIAAVCRAGPSLAARPIWLKASDNVRLYALEGGSGATAVVLAPQGGGDVCGWLPYVKTLIEAKLRVVAFDFRGSGDSQSAGDPNALDLDLAAAVARARADGAERVFLVGASRGGAAIVQNSAGIRVDGRISLSGTRLWPGFGLNDYASLRRLRAPFLYIGSREDANAPRAEAASIFRKIGARDKRMVLYAGSWHGWDLVELAPFAPRVRALILGWIRAHS
jgi:alpha-beta hydrolase superfamily lysophospholipase